MLFRSIAAPDHILYGSDWPYCPDNMTKDMIKGTTSSGFFDEKQLKAINRGNAVKLFPRFK